jgi:hypothetical protein
MRGRYKLSRRKQIIEALKQCAAVDHVVVDKALSGMGRDGSVPANKSQEMVISAQSPK